MPSKDPRFSLLESIFRLERIANAMVDDSDGLLRAAFDEIAGEIAKLDPTAVQLRYRKDRLSRLVERMKAILGTTYEEWQATQRAALAAAGAHEASGTVHYLRGVLGAGNEGLVSSSTGLSANYFKRIIDATPFEGATLKEWAAERSRVTLFRVSQQVKLGVARGESVDEIVRRVRGKSVGRPGKYVGGVLQTTTRDAESLVRTAVSDITTHARFGVYDQNADLMDGYQLVVTMDGRTSPICIHYGLTPEKVYPMDSGPRPPFHWRCRTTTVPSVAWDRLGLTPPPEGTRATATGQKRGDIDFDAWLRDAPATYAADLLGPSRARLFRAGKLDLRQLLRTDGGRVRLVRVAEAARAAD